MRYPRARGENRRTRGSPRAGFSSDPVRGGYLLRMWGCRRLLRPLAVAVAGTLAVPAVSDARAVSFQADPAHTGNAGDAGLVPPLALRWSRTLGDWVSYPIIADGKVFVTVDPGDHSNHGYGSVLYALDQASGAVVWSRDVAGTYWRSNAAYDSGRLFVVNEDGLVRAYATGDGALLWESTWGGYGFTSNPVAENGRVFYSAATGDVTGSGALSQADGRVLWTAQTPSSEGTPAADGSRFYLGAPCGRAYALDQQSGALAWSHTDGCTGGGGVFATVHGGRLYMKDNFGDKRIVDTSSGARAGTFEGNHPPAIADGVAVYLVGTSARAVDLASGATMWQAEGDGALNSMPLIANGIAWIGSTNGNVFGFDVRTGRVVWSGPVGQPVYTAAPGAAPPTPGVGAADGLLVVGATGTVVALDSRGTQPPAGAPPEVGGRGLAVMTRRSLSWRVARRKGVGVTVKAAGAVRQIRVRITDSRGHVVARAHRRTRAAATRLRPRIARSWRPRRPRERLTVRVGAVHTDATESHASRSILLRR